MSEARMLDALTQSLRGDHLIEASAGTGKTFTIAFLYVRLVLGHQGPDQQPLGQGLTPADILVVTFTEAATKELRDRIRQRLTEAADYFAIAPEQAPAEPAQSDLLARLRASIPATLWPVCRRRLMLAAESMDEAAISTIHGWCNRMLNEHAFDSGSLFRQTLKTDELELLDEVVRDYWRTFFYPLGEDLMDEVLTLWKHPEALRQSLRNLLPLVDALPAPEREDDVEGVIQAVIAQRQHRASELKALPWADWQPEVTDLLNELGKAKRLNGNSKNAMLKVWEPLLAWAGNDELLPDKITGAGYSNQTPDGLAEKVTGEGEIPQHPAFDAFAELLAFNASMPSPRQSLLIHATRWVVARVEQQQQQRAEMGFNDLLTRLDRALQQPEQGARLATRIRQQFPVALIDEFQDTDPVQFRIFQTVYRIGGNSAESGLLLIGDPKQAIYAFRGADIHTYLKAREGVAERLYTLGTNFRSSAAMVDSVNALFAAADDQLPEGAFLFRAGASNRLPFFAVDANGRPEQWQVESGSQPALTLWSHSDDKAVGVTESRILLADACASEIVRLLMLARAGKAGFGDGSQPLKPLKPKDIAILVNGVTEANAVRAALSRRRVRSVYLSDRSSVLHSPAALDVLHWLRACAEPRQLSLLRAALGTSMLALPFDRLERLLTDEQALEQEIDAFLVYQQIWQSQGILPMLRRFLMEHRVPETLLRGPDGERLLTDLLHVAELLQQASQQLDGEQALIHHYADMLRNADDESEHLHMRLESDADLVQVVTIHKSKGLEYPLVFLPFATSFREQDRKAPFLKTHDDQGNVQVWLEPDDDTLALADRERLGEDIRKLYVALTRARYATWVGAAAIRGWEKSGLGYLLGSHGGQLEPALESLAARHPAITTTPVPTPTDARFEPLPQAEPGEALRPLRPAREHWWIASYSAISYGAVNDASALAELPVETESASQENLRDEDPVADAGPRPVLLAANHHGFPAGPGPGTFLHDLLEWCGHQGFAHVLADPQPLRELLERRCRLRQWDDWVEPLQHWLLALLRLPMPLPTADGNGGEARALAELTKVKPELEFWFESHRVDIPALDGLVCRHILPGQRRPAAVPALFNGMLKGFIDLVFEVDGCYYLLDYKSNRIGDDDDSYTADAMEQKILESRYDLQYALYTLALHRLLKARLPDYDYDRHLGGAIYLFLRGHESQSAGVYRHRPPRELIEAMDQLFAGKEQAA